MDTSLISLIAAAIGAFGSIVAAVLGVWIQRRRLGIEGEAVTTEQRIAGLTTALSESSSVIQEIEAEMKHRTELVEKLKRDADHYEQLSNIKREEAEAVAQGLRGELRKEGRRSLLTNFLMNFVFLCLG